MSGVSDLLRRFDTVATRYWGLSEAWGFLFGICLIVAAVFVDTPTRWFALGIGIAVELAILSSFTQPRTKREASLRARRFGEYWWLGVALPMGIGCWGTFAYLSYRLRRPALGWCALGYFVPLVAAATLNVLAHDEGALSAAALGLFLGTWVVGIAHAFAIRVPVRAGLNELKEPTTVATASVADTPTDADDARVVPLDRSQRLVLIGTFVAALITALLYGFLDSRLVLFAVPVIVFVGSRWGYRESARSVVGLTLALLVVALVLNLA